MMYCEKIKETLKQKIVIRKAIINELIDAKTVWNYPKIKAYESKEELIDLELKQINMILNLIKGSCPVENVSEELCKIRCKSYYDYLIEQNKNIEAMK